MSTSENPARAEQRIPGTWLGFTAFGVPVRFHFTFILLAVFLLVFGWGGKQSAVADILFVAALFASVLLHELGHALTARRFGVRTIEIVMFPIGGVASLERNPPPRAELWVAAAGPLVNFVIAGIILSVLVFARGAQLAGIEALASPSDADLLERIAFGNLILAVFNLLPAYPMDGGRILRSLLARWKPENEATRIASATGRILAIGLGLYGLISMNFMLIFVAFFVYLGAAQEGQLAAGRSLTEGVPARMAMIRRFQTLPHGSSIGQAAQLLLDTSQQDFPVLHGERVIGLLDRNTLMRAMAGKGPDAYVSEVMARDFTRIGPDDDLAEALPAILGGSPCALVMDEDRLLGLLTRDNLMEYLMLRRVGLAPGRPALER